MAARCWPRLRGGAINLGYFYDAQGNKWPAAAWPTSNLSQPVTLTGTRLTVIVGTNKATRDYTPIAFLGVTQVSGSPNFTISAAPASLSIPQGNQGTSTITTAISGGFDSAITLSASGMPSGTTVSFNPNPIPAPGSGSSTMTITVGSSTPTGIYPITVTGNGGGIQQNSTVTLTVTSTGGQGFGFDFRNTAAFVTDPPGDTYVLSTTAYPTTVNGVTFGWMKPSPVGARDRNAKFDPRLAGINYVSNNSPATFYVDLSSAGTYNLSLAMGDAGYEQCFTQCQVQFLDGSTVLATVTGGPTKAGYFYDAQGNNWSAATWPTSNLSQQVTLTGTRLTVVVGTNKATGDYTPIAFLGVAQASGSPNFTISASPASLSIAQGNQGTSTITTTISGGFNSAISLSASGMPSGTTVSFNPNPIAAPGSGTSTMTVTVGASTPVGTYPIMVTGNGGGIQQNATVTLTVTQSGGQGPSSAYLEQPYSFTLQSSFGTPPYTYQLESGSLPPGLTMDQSGDITGVPTATGQFPFEVLVTDSSQPPQQQTYNYTLNVLIAVTTYHNDNYRSGANTNETVLNPSNVNVQTFGKRSVFAVQGYVYAQPLYVPGVNIGGTLHNVVYIATEHDQVYAFDVNSGQQIWQTSFLSSGGNLTVSTVLSTDLGCSDIVPEIGITGTPVIDTSTGTLYLVAKTKEYNSQTKKTTFYQTLHALDITTGLDKVPFQRITAVTPGTGTGSSGGMLTFNPLREGQRSALLLESGQVFISWASHCDIGPFHGYMMAYDETTLAQTGVFVSTPNGEDGGFWASGAGPAVDSSGAIYFASGNGDFTANTGGIDYGDSILRLSWSSAGQSFTVVDYFTPWDQETMDQKDEDLGAGGVLLLPDQPGTTYPHLLVQAGKKNDIYLVDRDDMGQWNSSGNDSQIVQSLLNVIGPEFGAPALWNNSIYFGGSENSLKAFAFDPKAQQLSATFTSGTPESFGYPGPTPSVSSNGNANAIVWIAQDDAYDKGGNAVLRAYDATNLRAELYNSKQNIARDAAGLAAKFTVTTVVDGLVFLGAKNEVDMYGLLP